MKNDALRQMSPLERQIGEDPIWVESLEIYYDPKV